MQPAQSWCNTSAHDQAGCLAVEISNACQEPVAPIAVVVTPVYDPSSGLVVDCIKCCARLTVKHCQILGSIEYPASRVAVVCVRIAYHLPQPVDCPISSLARYLCLSITVKIVDHELRVVGPGSDVPSEVDPPHMRAVQLVRIEKDLACISIVRVVMRV